MHGGSGQEAELDLRVRRLESLARPTAGADGDERLIDRPAAPCLSISGCNKRRDAFLLIWFKPIYGERNEGDRDQHDANQIAQRNAADEKQRQQDRPPNDGIRPSPVASG